MLKKRLFTIKLGPWLFSPGLIPSLLVLLLLPLLISLGFWQLDRAQEKQDIMANLAAKSLLEPVSLGKAMQRGKSAGQTIDQTPVVFLGQPVEEFTIVTDNQKQGKRLGYEIFSLFIAEDFPEPIIVSRGWLPRKDFYQKVPQVPEFTDSLIKGTIYQSKGDNSVINQNALWEQSQNLHLIGQFDLKTIREKINQIGYDSAPFVVRQQPEPGSEFVRDWPLISSPPQKHIAYAVQWFAMALALIIIFIVVNSKKSTVISRN